MTVATDANNRPRKVGIPKFLRFLHDILKDEDPKIIRWAHNGLSFQILDIEGMSNQILHKYFKHRKYASFQRQLNYFGFRKWTKTQTDICTFSHEHFTRDKPAEMRLIRRKNHPENPGSRPKKVYQNKPKRERDGLLAEDRRSRNANDLLIMDLIGVTNHVSNDNNHLNRLMFSNPPLMAPPSLGKPSWVDSLFDFSIPEVQGQHKPHVNVTPQMTMTENDTDEHYLDFLALELADTRMDDLPSFNSFSPM